MFYSFLLLLMFLIENAGAIILIILVLFLIGVIAEYIEIACIALGVISVIISSLCYGYITDYCFNKKFIGILVAIAAHAFFFLTIGLSGWLFFVLLLVGFFSIIAYSACDEFETLSIIIALATILIPAIIVINGLI